MDPDNHPAAASSAVDYMRVAGPLIVSKKLLSAVGTIMDKNGFNLDQEGRSDYVNKETEKQIEQIEETQEALRESIDQARELVVKADKLLKRHKKALKDMASG